MHDQHPEHPIVGCYDDGPDPGSSKAGAGGTGGGVLRLAPAARAAVTMRQFVLKQGIRGMSKELYTSSRISDVRGVQCSRYR